nr:MAG TPA: hypothetical protein [Caudoviricetes sp.]
MAYRNYDSKLEQELLLKKCKRRAQHGKCHEYEIGSADI